jgi:ATP-dependent DNA helicase RecG
LPEQLISLVRDLLSMRCESQQVELKRAEPGVPEKLYGTMSAFANQTGGGTVIFGVHENGGYLKANAAYSESPCTIYVIIRRR